MRRLFLFSCLYSKDKARARSCIDELSFWNSQPGSIQKLSKCALQLTNYLSLLLLYPLKKTQSVKMTIHLGWSQALLLSSICSKQSKSVELHIRHADISTINLLIERTNLWTLSGYLKKLAGIIVLFT